MLSKKLLNLSMERIKLLEKRGQARVRQLQRDVIELLQLKKEQKVDPLLLRLWKEVCLFSVYAKIAEYCKLAQSSLKDIANQRECPSGLEEPVAGLCFAASCCADLPELQELREMLAMKYGKPIVSSGQDLKPNCHVNQQFVNCLYAKDPSGKGKQDLLEEIITKHNAMQGFEQDTLPLELCDSVSREGSADAKGCNQLKEGIGNMMKASEVQNQSEYEELKVVDVGQESFCNLQNSTSMELGNELANRKRTLEDRKMHNSAFKRADWRRKFEPKRGMGGEGNGGKEHEQGAGKAHDFGNEVCSNAVKRLATCEDLNVAHYIQKPSISKTPQRPPPPPPSKRAPPPSLSLPVISMPGFCNIKRVIDYTSLSHCCSTMANDYYVESYGSHVHPRLPKYDDVVANFTAIKRQLPMYHYHIAGGSGQVF